MVMNVVVCMVVLGGVRFGGEIEGVDAEAVKEFVCVCGEVEMIMELCLDDVMKLVKICEDGCKCGVMLVVYKDEEMVREVVRALYGKSSKVKLYWRWKSKDMDVKDVDEFKEYIWVCVFGGEGLKLK